MAEGKLKNQPMVSIVIPSYNSMHFVRNCLSSVLRTNYPNFEVLFVDDGSVDGSLEYVEDNFEYDSRLTIIRNSKRLGLAASRNVGIKASVGKYVAFIETDMEVDLDWMDEAVKILEGEKSIGAVQCKVLDINHRRRIQQIGVYINPHTGWVIGRGFGEVDRGQYDSAEEVSGGGVGLLVRRTVFQRIGGFDEKLVHTTDDIDLPWRMWIGNYRIVTVPNAVVYHWTCKPWRLREKTISRALSEFHLYKGLRMLIKNLETINLIRYLPTAFAVQFVAVLRNLARGNIWALPSIIKANLWNLKNLGDTLDERHMIQRFIRKASDKYIMQKIMVKDFRDYLRHKLYVDSMTKFFDSENYPAVIEKESI